MADESQGRSRKVLRGIGRFFVRGVVGLLVLEVVLRIGAFAWFGGSTYYLFYGLHSAIGRVSVSPWSVENGNYFKYPPNYTLKGAIGQAHETARTNSLGFRGPDFEPEKPPGTFRIACLGGSSTFGFHDSDTGTYPYLLQGLLRETHPNVEVINGGFPYYNSGSILSLLREELIDYDLDLITLYSGYNDTGRPGEVGPAMRALFWLQQHSMTVLVLKQAVLTDERMYQLRSRLQREDPHAQDRELFETSCDFVAERYVRNVEAILDLAAERGVQAILIAQPVSTAHKHPERRSMTYAEECALVRGRLERGEELSEWDFGLLRHERLMRELKAIAERRGLPWVDNIALVDEDRSGLSSWVHLTEAANLRLARALRDAILPFLPPLGGERAAGTGSGNAAD